MRESDPSECEKRRGKEEKTMALEETKRFVYAHLGPGNHTTPTIQRLQYTDYLRWNTDTQSPSHLPIMNLFHLQGK